MTRTPRPHLSPAALSRTFGALAVLAVPLAACQSASSNRPPAAVTAACRQEVDRVWAAQNRVDLSTRDTSATPFSNNFVSGVASEGLSSQFRRQNMQRDCVNNALGQGGERAAPANTPAPGAATGAAPAGAAPAMTAPARQ